MSEARPIGDILAAPIARAKRLHLFQLRVRQASPSVAKTWIMAMRQRGAINDDECAMLIEAHELEAA